MFLINHNPSPSCTPQQCASDERASARCVRVLGAQPSPGLDLFDFLLEFVPESKEPKPMIHKRKSSTPGHVRVVFELPSCIWADRVFVVGDFNQWAKRATPMQQDREGVWRAVVDLPAGSRCGFRYLIDGQWKTDYHADAYTSGELGAEQSVVCAVLPEAARLAPVLQS